MITYYNALICFFHSFHAGLFPENKISLIRAFSARKLSKVDNFVFFGIIAFFQNRSFFLIFIITYFESSFHFILSYKHLMIFLLISLYSLLIYLIANLQSYFTQIGINILGLSFKVEGTIQHKYSSRIEVKTGTSCSLPSTLTTTQESEGFYCCWQLFLFTHYPERDVLCSNADRDKDFQPSPKR